MKKFYSIIVMAYVSATPVLADFSDGVIAYSMGEYKQAYNTMRSLAETSDHGLAQYYVAMMYLKGNGVGQSYEEAAKWFRKSAEQRIKQAQYRLGELYMSGRGVPKDYEYAYAWYRVGAEHQHKKAMGSLAQAKANLSAEELEEAEKLSRKFIRQFGPLSEQEQKAQTIDNE